MSKVETVFAAFMATAASAPGNAFLCVPPAAGRAYHPDGVEFTYEQSREQILACQERYADAGYGLGHRVGLLLDNRSEFFFHYLALNGLGVAIVPINPDYRHDEILYLMDHSEADLAVALPERRSDLEAVARERAKPLPVVGPDLNDGRLPRPALAPGGLAPDHQEASPLALELVPDRRDVRPALPIDGGDPAGPRLRQERGGLVVGQGPDLLAQRIEHGHSRCRPCSARRRTIR